MPIFAVPPARRSLPLLAAFALPLAGAFAGPLTEADLPDKNPVQAVLDTLTPLNLISVEARYTGKSDFHTHAVNGQSQEETQEAIEYGHRIRLFGKTYLRLGASYERFDFNPTDTPLPSGLQSIAGIVGLEYVVNGKTGLFITSRPGVYFSDADSVSTRNFDFPTNIGGILPVIDRKFYLLLGVHTSILARYPVFPIGGVVWLISGQWRLETIPPTPRLVYAASDKLNLFVGGEITGDSFVRDRTSDNDPRDRRFSGGVIDYSAYRVGGGLTYAPRKGIEIEVSGGWTLERSFDYYRGGSGQRKSFDTTGAPFAKVAIGADF